MFSDQKRYLRLMQIISDLACLASTYLLFIPLTAVALSRDQFMDIVLQEFTASSLFYHSKEYIGLSFFYVFIPAGIFLILRQYRNAIPITFPKTCIKSLILSVIAGLFLPFLLNSFDISSVDKLVIILTSHAILFITLILNRYFLNYLVTKSDENENIIKHLLIVGTDSQSESLCNYIVKNPKSGLRVTGFLTRNKK